MLQGLKFRTFISKDEKGDEKRYYVVEQRVFLFIHRTLLVSTNYKTVSKWLKEALDQQLLDAAGIFG